ncbi:integral membrane protein [Colletotrichum asianum]
MIQPIETREGPDLSIHLLEPSAPLYPGSVIRGHVTRKSHIVAASATVRICLIGDSAARRQVQQGRSVVILGAGFEFWSRNAVSQVIHRGPVHIAPDSDTASQTWPFTLQPLPATWGMNVCDGYGFVEYYLEAEILVEGKKMDPIEASLPVRVLSRPAPALVTDFELQGTTTAGCVTSHRLAPGMEHAELTFNQKRQMFLGSKRVPAWHFNLRVECASVIQLGNPASIPFRLKIAPDRAKSSEVLRDVPQKVYLTNAVISLVSTGRVSCPSSGEVHEGTSTMTLPLGRTIANETGSPMIPSAAGESALDLGALLDASADPALHEQRRHYPLKPDYTTYCFSLSHTLKWEFHLVIAGESWECSGSQKVVVLPAAEGAEAEDAGVAEEPPAYDGPSGSAPAYENVIGDAVGSSSCVMEKS